MMQKRIPEREAKGGYFLNIKSTSVPSLVVDVTVECREGGRLCGLWVSKPLRFEPQLWDFVR